MDRPCIGLPAWLKNASGVDHRVHLVEGQTPVRRIADDGVTQVRVCRFDMGEASSELVGIANDSVYLDAGFGQGSDDRGPDEALAPSTRTRINLDRGSVDRAL